MANLFYYEEISSEKKVESESWGISVCCLFFLRAIIEVPITQARQLRGAV